MIRRFFPYKQGSLSGEVSGSVNDRHLEHMYLCKEVYVLDEEGNGCHGRRFLVEGSVLARLVDSSHDPWLYHRIYCRNTISFHPEQIMEYAGASAVTGIESSGQQWKGFIDKPTSYHGLYP